MNLIASDVSGGVKPQRNHLSSRERKLMKLNPWFEKLKNNKTFSALQLKEDDRIKILSVTKVIRD